MIADEHTPLRLIRELDADGHLRPAAIERSLRVLRDFRAVARGAGARPTVAYATAALREAANSGELLARARNESSVEIQILSAGHEARAACLGAVYSLPVDHGLVLDIGGGSLQLSRFHNRRVVRTWSLPLGALRISDDFLASNPPKPSEIRKLRAHLHRAFRRAGVPTLAKDELLVGTGGTIRNLAKIDARMREYPVPRLHGYELSRRGLLELLSLMTVLKRRALTVLPGLNAERADSIVGGGIAVECVLEHCRGSRLLVTGLGLREGLVLEALRLGASPPDQVRRNSVEALVGRFSTCDAARTARRVNLARALYRSIAPEPDTVLEEMLDHAATVLDIGRAVDYYRRHTHTASILRATSLLGFAHRQIAMVSAIVELSDQDRWSPRRYRPLLHEEDQPPLARAGLLLALADQIEHRLPPGPVPRLRCRVRDDEVVLREPALGSWEAPRFLSRFHRCFGRELVIQSERSTRS